MHRYVFIIIAFLLSACTQTPGEKPHHRTQAPEAKQESGADVPPMPDFTSIADVREKKKAFISYLLPLIKEANTRVIAERQLIERWYLEGDELSDEDREEIQQLLTKYRITSEDTDEQKELLLRRVNVIPPSLVLAQAANESGWGTSRFAQEGNNLFGQWCFSEGCGLVPEARGGGSRHEVKRFNSPLDSVESYIRNLNSHPRYRDLRDLRLKSLEDNGSVTGEELIPGLTGYSELGEDYTDLIRNMIEYNKLNRFDNGLQSKAPASNASGGSSASQ